ncbi:MAG: hypothetical protein GY938_17045 [Ketobacter sp.]|nr:hypothetical protein [Ketobacter sp.]
MKKREEETEKLKEALQSNDIIAEVIKYSAIWEASLDRYLAIEFGGTNERYDDFIELIAPNMTFSRKIEIFHKMTFPRQTKSHVSIVQTLTRIRKIRNHLAHAHRLDSKTMSKIQSDRDLVNFILQYPESFNEENNKLKNWFSHLWRSWETRLKKERAYWAKWIKENPGSGYDRF